MLEDPSVVRRESHPPRASRVTRSGVLPGITTELWMGGAHTPHGHHLAREGLANSWLIDCAGDIDRSYREATGRWLACVFPDIDGPLSASQRITDVVREAVEGIRCSVGGAPERLYVMCQHGMNRSGLVTGLILRELGVSPSDAIAMISAARPGALANDYFRGLILRG